MKNLLEQALFAELNKDPSASQLLRKFVISRAAQINEALRKGKEFVLEDIDGPSIPDVSMDESDLLIDEPGASDDSDEDEDDFSIDGFDADADHDGELSDDEKQAAFDHLEAAMAELEAMFGEDDEDDTKAEDEPAPAPVAESRIGRRRRVRESTKITRQTDGTVEVEFEDAVGAVDSDADISIDPMVDDADDTDVEDTSDVDVDTASDDDTDGVVVPTVESRRLLGRARVIEGRKNRASKINESFSSTGQEIAGNFLTALSVITPSRLKSVANGIDAVLATTLSAYLKNKNGFAAEFDSQVKDKVFTKSELTVLVANARQITLSVMKAHSEDIKAMQAKQK